MSLIESEVDSQSSMLEFSHSCKKNETDEQHLETNIQEEIIEGITLSEGILEDSSDKQHQEPATYQEAVTYTSMDSISSSSSNDGDHVNIANAIHSSYSSDTGNDNSGVLIYVPASDTDGIVHHTLSMGSCSVSMSQDCNLTYSANVANYTDINTSTVTIADCNNHHVQPSTAVTSTSSSSKHDSSPVTVTSNQQHGQQHYRSVTLSINIYA